MYKIEVRRPNKEIELKFRTFKNAGGRFMIEIYDKGERKTAVSFDKVSTQTPSTLLSRWVNHFLFKDLLNISGKGSSIESIKDDGESSWVFRNESSIFGLNDVVDKNGKVKKVNIDDSIGMKNVVAILKLIGYNVKTEYDKKLNRVSKILLCKGELL